MESTKNENLTIKKASEKNLSSIIKSSESQSILITSANANAGVTSSTLSLADELSKTTDEKTLIIDTSLSDESLTTLLELDNALGLLDIDMENDSELERHYEKVKDQNFYLMPIGIKKNNIQNIIYKDLKTILDELSKIFKYIIIDGDAIYSNNNTIEVASKADAVVLVIQAEETRWEVAQAAQKRLSQAGVNIIGCIFNNRKYYTPSWIYNKL